jgi:hypothetical protein
VCWSLQIITQPISHIKIIFIRSLKVLFKKGKQQRVRNKYRTCQPQYFKLVLVAFLCMLMQATKETSFYDSGSHKLKTKHGRYF